MRTTIVLDPDVAAAVESLSRERSVGRSEAVNQLIRAGLKERKEAKPFRQRSRSMGLRIDVTNVAEALDLLDGPASRR